MWKKAALVAGIFLVLAFIQAVRATTDTVVGGPVDDHNTFNNNLIYASNLSASASGVLTSIGIELNSSGSGTTGVVGIYADNGTGGPAALLMENVSAFCAGTGWCDLPIGNITITAGTKYWLAFEPDGTVVINTMTSSVAPYMSKRVSQTYNGSLPANFGLTTDYSAFIHLRMTYNLTTNGPIWSGNATYNSSAAYDPAALYGFQINWTADGLFNTTNVTFVSNFTGTDISYTNSTTPAVRNNTPNTFFINFTQAQFASVGAYGYRWLATNGTGNATGTWTFSIPQASGGTASLSSSAGWNIAAYSVTTITCTESLGLPVTLTKDGVALSNPYTAQFVAGIYNITCQLTDTANYTSAGATQQLNVLSAGAGCWNATSYVYAATVAGSAMQDAFNFTALAASGMVKSDLSDVYVSTANTTSAVQLNSTHKLFLVNSSNVTSFIISFGNGLVNNNYTNVTATNATLTPYSYTQSASYYYYVNILDEMTGTAMSMPMNNASLQLTMNCANGANMVAFNSSKFMIPTLQQLTSARVTATYTATSVYYRDLQNIVPVGFLNFYMLDATSFQVLQILIQLQDNTGQATSPILLITKTVGGGTATITQLPFDIEKKAIIYLENGGTYQITIQSGSSTWVLGNIFADNVNLQKTVVISSTISVDQNVGRANYYFSQSGSNIVFTYFDPANLTVWVNMSVYTQNGTWVNNFTSHNSNNVQFVQNMTDNTTYYARAVIWNSWFGDAPVISAQAFNNFVTTIISPLLYNSPGLSVIPFTILQFIAGLAIVTIPMFFDAANGTTGVIIDAIAAIGFFAMGWWNSSLTVLALGALLAFFNKITEKRDVNQ